MNRIAEFTEILYELIGKQNLSLIEALEIMKADVRQRGISRTAEHIHKSINRGVSFSAALRTCEEINFDEVYITFISLAEKTGNLKEVCKFLLERCGRKEENTNKLVETCIYPVFVIVLAIFGAVLIYKTQGAMMQGCEGNENINGRVSESLIRAFIFLGFFCVSAFLLIGNVFGESRLYESFLAADFLTKAGICMDDVLEECVYVAGINSYLGSEFLKVRKQIACGTDLKLAFKNIEKFYRPIRFSVQIPCDEKSFFSRIVAVIKRTEVKKRRLCLAMIEPCFTLGTGVFLLILLTGIYGNGLFGISI